MDPVKRGEKSTKREKSTNEEKSTKREKSKKATSKNASKSNKSKKATEGDVKEATKPMLINARSKASTKVDEKALKEWGYTVWGDETEEEKKLMMFEKGLVKAVSVVDARAARWNGEIIAKSPIWKEMDGITYFPRRFVKKECIVSSKTKTYTPWIGLCEYSTVIGSGKQNKDAAFFYKETLKSAASVERCYGFRRGVKIDVVTVEVPVMGEAGDGELIIEENGMSDTSMTEIAPKIALKDTISTDTSALGTSTSVVEEIVAEVTEVVEEIEEIEEVEIEDLEEQVEVVEQMEVVEQIEEVLTEQTKPVQSKAARVPSIANRLSSLKEQGDMDMTVPMIAAA